MPWQHSGDGKWNTPNSYFRRISYVKHVWKSGCVKSIGKKGLIGEDEVLEEICQLKEEHLEKRKQIGQT